MERSPRRLVVLVAALPVAAVLLGPSALDNPQAAPVVTAGPEPVADRRPPAPTGPPVPRRATVLPEPPTVLDCFPIGRVEPQEPGPVPFPGTRPTVPGPVPIPEVAITCDSDLLTPR